MNAIIFSKDRPLQLDALLRSIEANCNHFSRITVLYTTQYSDSYRKLVERYWEVDFMHEIIFRNDFLILVEQSDDRVCLLVDDDIIFKPVIHHELLEMEQEVDIISLRLGDNITKKLHFEYKGSLDGNIFRKYDLEMLADHEFINPNKLEIRLTKLLKDRTMGWFKESKLIGIPANRVSDTSGCDSMGVDTEGLHELFLMGYEIDFEAMDLECSNVHKNVHYKYRKR